MSENDAVNHPSHYTAYKGLEIIDLTEQMNFNRGNAVKYIARAGLKNPDAEIQDLEKAAWYVNREIERLRGLIVMAPEKNSCDITCDVCGEELRRVKNTDRLWDCEGCKNVIIIENDVQRPWVLTKKTVCPCRDCSGDYQELSE